MSCIKIKFENFWPTFDINDNKFLSALRSQHDVNVLGPDSSDKPDILFYSRCGRPKHFEYDCLKIYYTGENDVPDFNECDYAISFYDIDINGRSLRYPLYMMYEYNLCLNPKSLTDSEALDRGFCSLLMRNHTNCDPMRLKIIDAVESYKPITYGGPFRNNIGGNVVEKLPFISKFRFNLALENTIVEGYVTEKLLEALAARTVPIYWGSDAAARDFNPNAFINVNDYDSIDSLIRNLASIDSDNSRYLSYLRAPIFNSDGPIDFDSRLADFLCRIADNPRKRIPSYGEARVLRTRNKYLSSLWSNSFTRTCSKLLSLLT